MITLSRTTATAAVLLAAAACTNEPLAPTRAVPSTHAARAATAAAGAFLHPNSEKYSDKGAKPSTGRSGSASITSRALLAKDGSVLVEASTGALDTDAAAPGQIAKVQLKSITSSGDALTTTNFNGLKAGASWSTTISGVGRNAPLQVQANVRGIDGNRTDVVTVLDAVKLRPDLVVATPNAPAKAYVNTSFVVHALVAERNGDVGATSTCRLFVDGQQVDQVLGMWVDAGQGVSCVFSTTIANAGTHSLVVKATDVVPRDWDSANNAASTSIDVVLPIVNMSWSVNAQSSLTQYAQEGHYHYNNCASSWYSWYYMSTVNCGGDFDYGSSNSYGNAYFGFSAFTSESGVALPATLAFTASTDAGTLGTLNAPITNGGCTWVYDASTSMNGYVCANPGTTQVTANRYAGASSYYSYQYGVQYYTNASYCSYDWWYDEYYCTGSGVTSTSPYSYSYNSGNASSSVFALTGNLVFDMTLTDASGRKYVAGSTVPVTQAPSNHVTRTPYCYQYSSYYEYSDCGSNTESYTYSWASASGIGKP